MTRNTSTIASTSVWMTLSIEALMKGVVSNGTRHVISGGKFASSSCMRVRTASAVATALAPAASCTPMPAISLPFSVALKP